jgi:hypothetical protein
MQGEWKDINVRLDPDDSSGSSVIGFFQLGRYPSSKESFRQLKLMQLADFVYNPNSCAILKNRLGTIEDLYVSASKYSSLQHHPNPQIRKMLEKIEMLASLAE